MSPSSLMEKAATAIPGKSEAGPKWLRLWPAYTLLRQRGFTCKGAVNWLVREGEIQKQDADRALESFYQIATRRNKKQSKP